MVILDPFMGIGNAGLADKRTRVNCVGFEIDTNYYDTNLRLLESEYSTRTLDCLE